MERQIDPYNELWTTHDNLLIEAEALRSQVTILSSGGRAEGASGWLGGRVVGLKEQAVGLEVLAVGPRVQVIGPEEGILSLRG